MGQWTFTHVLRSIEFIENYFDAPFERITFVSRNSSKDRFAKGERYEFWRNSLFHKSKPLPSWSQNSAFGWLDETSYTLKKRRFPSTIVSNNTNPISFTEGEADISKQDFIE